MTTQHSGISKLQRQRCLEYAKTLAELAADAPDDQLKHQVYQVVYSARQRFGYTHEQKRAKVLQSIRLGAWTLSDLRNELPFTHPEMCEILTELEREGHLVIEKIRINQNGPRTTHYSLGEKIL